MSGWCCSSISVQVFLVTCAIAPFNLVFGLFVIQRAP